MPNSESSSSEAPLQQPVSATHEGWTVESADASRPTDAQMLERIGAEPEPVTSDDPQPDPPITAVVDEKSAEPVAAAVTDPPKTERPKGKPSATERTAQINREIAQLTREKGETARERDAMRLEIETLKRERAALTAPAEPKPAVDPKPAPVEPPMPTWSAFEAQGKSYDDYQLALIDWKVAKQLSIERDAIRAELTKDVDTRLSARDVAAQAEQERQAAARASAAIGAQHQARLATAREKYPDFETRLDPNQVLSRPMIDCIVRSPLGPETMLYLAEHVEEADEIRELHPILAVERMGMIRARLEAANSGSAPVASPSRTRPPIQPVGGASAVAREASTSLDADFGPEWVAAETRREAEAKRRRA